MSEQVYHRVMETRLTDDGRTALFDGILSAVEEQEGEKVIKTLEELHTLGMSHERAIKLFDTIWDAAVAYASAMGEKAFIVGAELGYRALVVATDGNKDDSK